MSETITTGIMLERLGECWDSTEKGFWDSTFSESDRTKIFRNREALAAIGARLEMADRMEARIKKLETALRILSNRPHVENDEDSFYSCPKSKSGCLDKTQGNKCNCGADEQNEIIRAALEEKEG
jgi:hypothetical protein